MIRFSLKPDPEMRWIYNYYSPHYNSDQARSLRGARASALSHCPQWALDEASRNDLMRDKAKP